MNIQFFDNKVSSVVQNDTFGYAKNAIFRLGWEDSLEPEKYTLNSHSGWTLDNVKTAGLWDPIQECIQECEFFPSHYVVDRIVVNLVRPCDVHYIHHHKNEFAVLYYINLEWRDGWHGETLFYNPHNLDEIICASVYKPGRIILFDGNIPHTIRPQSVEAPKYRFSVSVFFKNHS